MNKKISLLLALIMLFSMCQPINAANFKDVPADHWAKSYIDRCTSEGIVKGYDDGTFKPSKNISFTEATSLLSRVISVSPSELQAANQVYGAQVTDILDNIVKKDNPGIDWVKNDILKCLQKGVYTVTNLKKAAESGMLNDLDKPAPVSRSNFAIFLINAMGLQSAADAKAFSLPYKDANVIPVNALKSVGMLLEIGVLNPQGDGNGNFLPDSPIDRASIAKMMTTALDYLKANPNKSTSSNTQAPIVTQITSTVTGKVTDVSLFGGKTLLLIQSGNNATAQAYTISEPTTPFMIDNQLALFDKIEKGMDATIKVNANKEVTEGSFKTNLTTVDGVIKEVISTYKYGIEYTSGSVVRTSTFDLTDAEITIDGSKAYASDLNVNYEVKLTMAGDKVKKVEAKKKNAGDGTFDSFGKYRGEYFVEFYISNSRSSRDKRSAKLAARYDTDTIYIDNRSYKVGDLTRSGYGRSYIKEGTPIKLKFNNYNEVTEITTAKSDYSTYNGTVYGYIQTSPYNNDSYIKIAEKKNAYRNDVYELKLDRNVDVRKGNSSRSYYLQDINTDDYVEVEIRNGYVTRITVTTESSSKYNTKKAYGKIIEMDNSATNEVGIEIDSDYYSDFDYAQSLDMLFDSSCKYYYKGSNYSDAKDRIYEDVRYNRNNRIKFEYYKSGNRYYITAIDLYW